MKSVLHVCICLQTQTNTLKDNTLYQPHINIQVYYNKVNTLIYYVNI